MFFLSFHFICILEVHAASTIASSCSQYDVQTAISSASDRDTVIVPVGNCTWSNQILISKGITLKGAGIDKTVIKSTSDKILRMEVAEPKSWRLTGFTFTGGTGAAGIVIVVSTAKNWRIDHVKFDNPVTQAINTNNSGYGLIDHCVFNLNGTIGIQMRHSEWNGKLYGDGSWADALYFGTEKALYIEDNTFSVAEGKMENVIDSVGGARWVFRNNAVINGNLTTHGTETTGRDRSVRSYEIYNNTFNVTGSLYTTLIQLRGGTGVIFGNTATKYKTLAQAVSFRDVHSFNVWGACDGTSNYDNNDGITYDVGNHTSGNGESILTNGIKNWQVNEWIGYSLHNTTAGKSSIITSNTATTISVHPDVFNGDLIWNNGDGYEIKKSYPCIDQVGMSTGNLLSGNPPVPIGWSQLTLEPVYEWNNTINGVDADIVSSSSHIQENRDYYNDTPKPGYIPYTYPHPLTVSPNPPTMLPIQ